MLRPWNPRQLQRKVNTAYKAPIMAMHLAMFLSNSDFVTIHGKVNTSGAKELYNLASV